MRERLEAEETVLFALWFGSRAGGRAREDSDWDLAVYLREELSPRERLAARLRLLAELQDIAPADLVILNEAPPLLGHRALHGRRILVRDPRAYVRYVIRTLAESEDERYFRDLHRAARDRRLAEGRFGRP